MYRAGWWCWLRDVVSMQSFGTPIIYSPCLICFGNLPKFLAWQHHWEHARAHHIKWGLLCHSRYQVQGHVITSHNICGMWLFVLSIDTCLWHSNPQMYPSECTPGFVLLCLVVELLFFIVDWCDIFIFILERQVISLVLLKYYWCIWVKLGNRYEYWKRHMF